MVQYTNITFHHPLLKKKWHLHEFCETDWLAPTKKSKVVEVSQAILHFHWNSRSVGCESLLLLFSFNQNGTMRECRRLGRGNNKGERVCKKCLFAWLCLCVCVRTTVPLCLQRLSSSLHGALSLSGLTL